jgi:hypothetical protein
MAFCFSIDTSTWPRHDKQVDVMLAVKLRFKQFCDVICVEDVTNLLISKANASVNR